MTGCIKMKTITCTPERPLAADVRAHLSLIRHSEVQRSHRIWCLKRSEEYGSSMITVLNSHFSLRQTNVALKIIYLSI